jgi:hypothetical protein
MPKEGGNAVGLEESQFEVVYRMLEKQLLGFDKNIVVDNLAAVVAHFRTFVVGKKVLVGGYFKISAKYCLENQVEDVSGTVGNLRAVNQQHFFVLQRVAFVICTICELAAGVLRR